MSAITRLGSTWVGIQTQAAWSDAKLSTSSSTPPATNLKGYVQQGQDPLAGVQAEERLGTSQTCRGTERVCMGVALGWHGPFLNGKRPSCLGHL